MPAATSAPNATRRMISVIGTENRPAFFRSSPNEPSIAWSALASPNDPTKNSGWAAWTVAIAGGDGVELVAGVVGSPRILELDQRGVAVRGDQAGVLRRQRRPDRSTTAVGLERVDRRRRWRPGTRGPRRSARALDQDDLGGRLLEAARRGSCRRGPTRPVRRSRETMSWCLPGAPGRTTTTTKRQPAEDGDLPVGALQRAIRAARFMGRRGAAPGPARITPRALHCPVRVLTTCSSSFRSADRPGSGPDQGMSTSFTSVAVVRSAT